MKKSNKAKRSPYFDDCQICRAVKQAEDNGRGLNANELSAVFKKAKNQMNEGKKES